MLNKNKKIEIKWNNANRKWFVNKGYEFTNWGDTFYVDVMDIHEGSPTKIFAICDYCGNEYITQYNIYTMGIKKYPKCACSNCKIKKSLEMKKEERVNKMYKKILDMAQSKNYTVITRKEEYNNQTTRIHYICPIHGKKTSSAANFIRGCGCLDCSREKNSNQKKLSIQEVKNRIESVNGNKLLNPEEYDGNMKNNLLIQCACGNTFYVRLSDYANKHYRCKQCAKSESNGEFQIRKYLENNNIKHITQYKFDNCKDKRPLPFDFYLPTYNMCIEFDGEQHFRSRKGWSNLEYLQNHDTIKNNYCKNNNIELVRIRYDEIDEIETILNNKLKIM